MQVDKKQGAELRVSTGYLLRGQGQAVLDLAVHGESSFAEENSLI